MAPKQKKAKHTAPGPSADSLEDDFALDQEYLSDPAEQIADTPTTTTAKKRQAPSETPAPVSKPAKKPKAGKIDKFTVPESLEEQADLWNKYLAKAYPGISQLELEPIKMQAKHMYQTTTPLPALDAVDHMEELAKTAVSSGKNKNKVMHGAPQVLVLCSSALRAVDLVRRLRPVSPRRNVLKLFSKHMKIDQQRKVLKENAVDVAVGTPNRILKLLEDGDLKVNRLRLVLFDCWQDEKMRVLVDMDDTRKDLFALWRDQLLPALANPDYGYKFRMM
ncbi:hypothetical protein GGI07_003889 [Coemansia sp. Benny D115]|nr:hypothetical protein GGI07_003889 [Coemansia sp. Benny D115]